MSSYMTNDQTSRKLFVSVVCVNAGMRVRLWVEIQTSATSVPNKQYARQRRLFRRRVKTRTCSEATQSSSPPAATVRRTGDGRLLPLTLSQVTAQTDQATRAVATTIESAAVGARGVLDRPHKQINTAPLTTIRSATHPGSGLNSVRRGPLLSAAATDVGR